MKLNIAYPAYGAMKVFEVEDPVRLAHLYGLRMGNEIEGDKLGEEFKGYVFRVTGGNDRDGFPMVQGVLSEGRVRLLVTKGSSYYRPRKVGERKRKSIRGCTVASDIKILNLSIVERGAEDLPGLTDGPSERPKRLGPKRATRIRKIFGLTKSEDIRKKITVREFTTKKGKTIRKRPKIQRLVTPLVLQRKRALRQEKREAVASAKKDEAEYKKLKAVRAAEHRASTKARRSSRKSSKKEESSETSKA